MSIKRVAVLGCSGSIGAQTVDIIENHRDAFKLAAVTVNRNTRYLQKLCVSHAPAFIGIADGDAGKDFSAPHYCDIYAGSDCNELAASLTDVDIVVIAVDGLAALPPLLAAIKADKRIAIANKEAIVCAGDIINAALSRSTATMIPVDSEQSAIFQCLNALEKSDVSRLILTASGGPFLHFTDEQMKSVTPEMALRHPNWSMGAKVTIDSATLANKGLELIEARNLYGIRDVTALIHPQSIVHSLVETVDGGMLAQLSQPDMRLPIQYALTYPRRIATNINRLDLAAAQKLEFFPPDTRRFGALALAHSVLEAGGGAAAVYDAANTAAVELFAAGRAAFTSIPALIDHALCSVPGRTLTCAADVFDIAREARERVYALANEKQELL